MLKVLKYRVQKIQKCKEHQQQLEIIHKVSYHKTSRNLNHSPIKYYESQASFMHAAVSEECLYCLQQWRADKREATVKL